MPLIALEDAGPRLSQLIEDARGGEEIILTRDSAPIAKLVPLDPDAPRPRFGSAKDVILYISDDFDAPLEDFKEYI